MVPTGLKWDTLSMLDVGLNQALNRSWLLVCVLEEAGTAAVNLTVSCHPLSIEVTAVCSFFVSLSDSQTAAHTLVLFAIIH